MTEKKVNLGIRATPERAKFLWHLSADSGKSVQRLVDEALDSAYFAKSESNSPEELGKCTDIGTYSSAILTPGESSVGTLDQTMKMIAEILMDATPEEQRVVEFLVESVTLKVRMRSRDEKPGAGSTKDQPTSQGAETEKNGGAGDSASGPGNTVERVREIGKRHLGDQGDAGKSRRTPRRKA